MAWVVVQSQPQRESYARQFAEWFGWQTYLPLYEAERGKIKPLFPRYFFAQMIDGQWWRLRNTPGVTSIIREGDGYPAIVPDQQIEKLKKAENSKGLIAIPKRPWFHFNQTLRVRDAWHLLAGKDLLFKGMRGKDRAKLELVLFGQPHVVELDVKLLIVN